MLTKKHPRRFRTFTYVYPVVSRRSGGVSIGINLTNRCNFSCVYCQVLGSLDETGGNGSAKVDLEVLENELRSVVELVQSGELFEDEWFQQTPPEKRRLNDIAFSGDGEPTLSPVFGEAVKIAVNVRAELCIPETKLVLITNATAFHVKQIAQAVESLMKNGGEIWAKLDAGSEGVYEKMSRSRVPFSQIVENIIETSRRFPIVLQTLFCSMNGIEPTEDELRDYIELLRKILECGGQIEKVQIYTVARNTPDPTVLPLSMEKMKAIAEQIRNTTRLDVESYYSQ